jgi:hypothetical protein
VGAPGLGTSCDGCLDQACMPDRTCDSTRLGDVVIQKHCFCADGYMACCARWSNHLITSTSCDFGTNPRPPCPAVRPMDGEACLVVNSCTYSDACCGPVEVFCDGTSWSSSTCFERLGSLHGESCSPAEQSQCVFPQDDASTLVCDCVDPQGRPFWQCNNHQGGSCPTLQPAEGSPCAGPGGVECDYEQPDAGIVVCICEMGDADETWRCAMNP